MTVNNNVQVTTQQNPSTTFSNDAVMKYAELEEALCIVEKLIDQGYTLAKWYESASNNHVRIPTEMKNAVYDPRITQRIIKAVKDACDNVVIGEEKELWTMIEGLVDKYKLSNVQELSLKLKEIVHDEDMLEELANKTNSKFPGKITCSNDFKKFFEEFLNQPQQQPVQQQGVFTDPNALINQINILAAQNQELRKQIGSMGVNPVV